MSVEEIKKQYRHGLLLLEEAFTSLKVLGLSDREATEELREADPDRVRSYGGISNLLVVR